VTSIVRLVARAAALGTLLSLAVPAIAAGIGGIDLRIAVLSTRDSRPYREARDGFNDQLHRQGVEADFRNFRLDGNASNTSRTLDQIEDYAPALVYTLGSRATRTALNAGLDAPVVACVVMSESTLTEGVNSTGVVLEFPVETQIEWLSQVLPRHKRIGVLYNPAQNAGTVEAASRAARKHGLTLISRAVEEPRDLPGALKDLGRRVDVLWGITDSVVVTAQTTERLLLFAYRNRIPFVGLSSAWVKAGAIYSLERDYLDLGAQCGEIAARVLEGESASAIPPATPRKVRLALNSRTVTHLKLDIPEAIVQQADQVFE